MVLTFLQRVLLVEALFLFVGTPFYCLLFGTFPSKSEENKPVTDYRIEEMPIKLKRTNSYAKKGNTYNIKSL